MIRADCCGSLSLFVLLFLAMMVATLMGVRIGRAMWRRTSVLAAVMRRGCRMVWLVPLHLHGRLVVLLHLHRCLIMPLHLRGRLSVPLHLHRSLMTVLGSRPPALRPWLCAVGLGMSRLLGRPFLSRRGSDMAGPRLRACM